MTTDGVVPTAAALRRRLFAVIPAAGHSRRMGRPKLLLPVQGTTVIARLLAALMHPAIVARVVVLRRDDLPLRQEVERGGGWPVAPDRDPPDMRASIECGLREIEAQWSPGADDGWLLVPGDHAQLEPATIAALIDAWIDRFPPFLVPTFAGQRGHPLLARWSTARLVAGLPPETGLNALLERSREETLLWPVDQIGVTLDLDTPEDYARMTARQ
ncbi:MAG: nucleotidyltransferase family protein [Planctomycetaceae bacterium]|nr:nucleotidyltransferase family protein [Planctomycetaceae bacterium]